MITQFTPSQGRLAGKTYFLPRYQEDDRTQRRRNTFQNIAKMPGSYLASGAMPMPLDYGTLQLIFDLTPEWLAHNPNGVNYYNGTADDTVAIMNARLHFNAAVSQGGVGLLVETLNAGVVDPVDSSAITSLTAQAIIADDLAIQTKYSHSTLTATLSIESGGWTVQPSGLFIPLI